MRTRITALAVSATTLAVMVLPTVAQAGGKHF